MHTTAQLLCKDVMAMATMMLEMVVMMLVILVVVAMQPRWLR